MLCDHRADIVCPAISQFVGTMPDLGPDFVSERRRESLIAARAGVCRNRGEQTVRDAELCERVAELEAVAQEAAVKDQGVDVRLHEAGGGEPARRVQGFAVREELCGPVDSTAEARGGISAQCTRFVFIGW